MSAKILEQVHIQTHQVAPELGLVVGWTPGVGIELLLEDGATVLARSILALSVEQIEFAVEQQSEVLVTFVGNDRNRAMIMGFVAETPTAPVQPADTTARSMEDGSTPDVIKVRANQEIQFRCGKASITLRRDGTVVIRGEKVISRAIKNNRITGGSVFIN